MKQVIGKDGKSRTVPLSQEDLDIIVADELYEANRDPVAERQAAIEQAINQNEPLKLILEAIEDTQGLIRGQLIANAKAKVV